MSQKDANGGANPTRQSTSASSSMSGATPRHSLLPSPDTSALIIDDLAYDSGSDDEMSIEAKRVLRRKKLEREKLQKLGMYNLTSTFIRYPFHDFVLTLAQFYSRLRLIPPSINFTITLVLFLNSHPLCPKFLSPLIFAHFTLTLFYP